MFCGHATSDRADVITNVPALVPKLTVEYRKNKRPYTAIYCPHGNGLYVAFAPKRQLVLDINFTPITLPSSAANNHTQPCKLVDAMPLNIAPMLQP